MLNSVSEVMTLNILKRYLKLNVNEVLVCSKRKFYGSVLSNVNL